MWGGGLAIQLSALDGGGGVGYLHSRQSHKTEGGRVAHPIIDYTQCKQVHCKTSRSVAGTEVREQIFMFWFPVHHRYDAVSGSEEP